MKRVERASPILPWRFGLFLALTATIPLLVSFLGTARAVLVGFDLAAIVFLLTLPALFARGDCASMRVHARQDDANRPMLLFLTVAISVAIMIAVVLELSEFPNAPAKILVIATLLIAWVFSNVVFALHYAHLYYSADESRDSGGAAFPSESFPTYWDFCYFAFILGMTFQTSDINITSGKWRKIVLAHSIAAFVFNIGVIAFTINIMAQ